MTIYNRPLTILRQTGSADDPPSTRAACFTFAELCENVRPPARSSPPPADVDRTRPSSPPQALGAADFLSICSAYGAIYISDVPALTLTKKNEARRLINLIDAMVCPSDSVFAPSRFLADLEPPLLADSTSTGSICTSSRTSRSTNSSSPRRPTARR